MWRCPKYLSDVIIARCRVSFHSDLPEQGQHSDAAARKKTMPGTIEIDRAPASSILLPLLSSVITQPPDGCKSTFLHSGVDGGDGAVSHSGGHLPDLLDPDITGGVDTGDLRLHLVIGGDVAVLQGSALCRAVCWGPRPRRQRRPQPGSSTVSMLPVHARWRSPARST